MIILLAFCLALIVLAIPLVQYLNKECNELQDALNRTERNLEYESALNLSLTHLNVGLETRVHDLKQSLSDTNGALRVSLSEINKSAEIFEKEISEKTNTIALLNKIVFDLENVNFELRVNLKNRQKTALIDLMNSDTTDQDIL